MKITQLPFSCSQCPWHKFHADGKEYSSENILPDNCCPILYHSLYPYFLGLLYNADMDGIHVCCPAHVNAYVYRKTNHGMFPNIPDDWWVIYANIISVNGECDHNHQVGQNIIFPTMYKADYMCPAGFNNIFPLIYPELPKCIDIDKMRCPDWKENIYYLLGER